MEILKAEMLKSKKVMNRQQLDFELQYLLWIK